LNRKVKAASLSILSNSVLVVTKLTVGVITGSVSVISEAAHSALDLFAAIIAFMSVRASGRPADKEHPFGHGKVENLSGVIEAVLILIAAAWIIFQAVKKMIHPEPVRALYWGLLVMAASVVANTLISRYLFKVAKESDSIALEADAHHLSTDVWTSIGVFVGLALIQILELFGLSWGEHIDPVVALFVAALIVRVAVSLSWKAAGPLLDMQLPDTEVRVIRQMVLSTPEIVGYHKLRTRKSGPFREIDYHLIVPAAMPVAQAHAIAENIEDEMREHFAGTHVVTHIEPDTAEILGEPDTVIRPPAPPDAPPPGVAD
jgi:cation diffusion facilitator family transporter